MARPSPGLPVGFPNSFAEAEPVLPYAEQLTQYQGAVLAYRADTPGTYFPAVPECDGLGDVDFRRIGEDLYHADELSRAQARLKQATRDGSDTAFCKAAHAVQYAGIKNGTAKFSTVDQCLPLQNYEYSEFADAAEAAYSKRAAEVLADAP